jgi:signal transduction histidine kinase
VSWSFDVDPTATQSAAGLAAAPFVGSLVAGMLVWRGLPSRIAVLGGLIAGPLAVLVHNPFLDPACTRACLPNPWSLTSAPGLEILLRVVGGLAVAVSCVVLLATTRRDPLGRFGLALAGASSLATSVRGTCLLWLAAAVGVFVWVRDTSRAAAARRAVADLTDALRSTPTDLAASLRTRLGDERLGVYYLIDDADHYVDRSGTPEPRVPAGRVSTPIRAEGRVLGHIHHNPRATELPALAAALDRSARLAVENDRLAADVAVRAARLRAARRRIVDRADAERRVLERDVHDGAQQHVLTLGIELRMTLTQLPPDGPLRGVVARCLAETELGLDELRDLSHGIYPAGIDDGSLIGALRSLAARSPVPLIVHGATDEGLAGPVKRTAFAVTSDMVAGAEKQVDVSVDVRDRVLVLTLTGGCDAVGEVTGDRVAAAGGALRQVPGGWEVMLACGSS